MYIYVGLHWACKLALSVSLLWASVPSGGHTAAWLGAQTPSASRWVQAGVANDSGSLVVYVEWNRPDYKGGYGIEFFPWSLHRALRVHLEHRGVLWRAGALGHWSPWIVLHHATRCSVLELFHGAHGAAVIDRRLVIG